jgi:hypothetical protein
MESGEYSTSKGTEGTEENDWETRGLGDLETAARVCRRVPESPSLRVVSFRVVRVFRG